MKNGKAMGPDEKPPVVWKLLNEDGIAWLIDLFNNILMNGKMPES